MRHVRSSVATALQYSCEKGGGAKGIGITLCFKTHASLPWTAGFPYESEPVHTCDCMALELGLQVEQAVNFAGTIREFDAELPGAWVATRDPTSRRKNQHLSLERIAALAMDAGSTHRWLRVKKVSVGVIKALRASRGVSALHGLLVSCFRRGSRGGSSLKGSSIASAGTLPSTRSRGSTFVIPNQEGPAKSGQKWHMAPSHARVVTYVARDLCVFPQLAYLAYAKLFEDLEDVWP